MSARKQNRANVVVGALVVLVAVVALAVFSWQRLGAGDGSWGMRALVHDSAGAVYEMPLSQDAQKVVETELGTNTVVVEGGAVYVSDADCDNHDCMHQGKIDAPGRQIICLPHKLWIEVVAEGGSAGQMDTGAAGGQNTAGDAGLGDGGATRGDGHAADSGYDAVAR